MSGIETERRTFSREFKPEVIARLEAGESGSALALELGVKRTIIYRYRRLGVEFRREGWSVNHKRLLMIMREDNLLCLRKPIFRPPTTDSRHSWRVWPNLARDLASMTVSQLWVAGACDCAWAG